MENQLKHKLVQKTNLNKFKTEVIPSVISHNRGNYKSIIKRKLEKLQKCGD